MAQENRFWQEDDRMKATAAQYRLIHFVPDPFNGGRVPIGAVIRSGGKILVRRTEEPPTAQCVGGHRAAAALRMVLSNFERVEAFDALPSSFGPHVTLSPARDLPVVSDPLEWIARHVLPPPSRSRIMRERGPTRATLGYQALKTWHVDHYIRKSFTPGQEQVDGFLDTGHGLPSITHWVLGKDSVLLMEPIVVDSRSTHVRDEVRQVITKFWAYRGVLQNQRGVRDGELCAYLVGPGSKGARGEVVQELRHAAHLVADVSDDTSRQALLARVRAVGQSYDAR